MSRSSRHARSRTAAAVAALALTAVALASTPASAVELRDYTIQPGDTCWSIAEKLFGEGRKYTLVHQHNDLGPMPHLLEPGQKLRLPESGATPDARVNWMRRDVKAKAPGAFDWRKARTDMELWKQYKVATGPGSSARVVFEDRTDLGMRENALLVIYGGSVAQARRDKLVKTTVFLEKGTLKGGLAALDGESTLTVKTPGSEVELMSRDSQVEVDEAQMSMVSVYDGKAGVTAAGAKVEVPQDFGTFVKKGARPAKPRPLPPAPRWESGMGDVTVPVPAGVPGAFEARWQPVAKASRYRVELAHDSDFKQVMADAVIGSGITRFRASDLARGRYYARVSAIDDVKLQGRPSDVLRVTVVDLATSRPLERAADGTWSAVGMLKLELDPELAAQVEVALDDGPWQPGTVPLRVAAAGDHVVRVRPVGGALASEVAVRLLAVRGALDGPQGVHPLASGAAEVTLVVTDEKGRPAPVPGITIGADPGGWQPVEDLGSGRYRARIPAPPAGAAGDVRVVARWAAGELGQTRVRFERAQAPPPPPSTPDDFGWRGTASGHEWGVGALVPPSRSAEPDGHVGIAIYGARSGARPELFASPPPLAGPDAEDGEHTRLFVGAHGTLALFDRRLALDVDVPVFAGRPGDDPPDAALVGNVRVGARGVMLRAAGFTVTPSFRVAIPSGLGDLYDDKAVFEPALLLQWRYEDLLTLATAQGALIESHSEVFDVARHYSGAYSLAVRPLDWLVLGLDAQTLLGPGRDQELSVGLGGAVQLLFDRVRVRISGGGGVGEPGRERLGQWSVGAGLDIGFTGP